ncbi:uncharacterized protein LOC110702298 [Chenopodium quinoa]|uniref:uncharacterized protein LOC110702298 n=1 Tax=Chenopodium quinoa TaxID=63459 RepID=UPI000B76F5AD|nr:uncharacterized protein LOC110702298 [Chenopodium quinoa]
MTQSISPLPKSPRLAMLDLNWNAAMKEEFDALTKQHIWDLVPRPSGVNIIRCMCFEYCFGEGLADTSIGRKNAFLHGDLKETVKSDNSLFILHRGRHSAYLLLYVDDIVLTASTEALKSEIIGLLQAEFAMSDLGSFRYFLGILVTKTPGSMFLCQHKYSQEIISRAKMEGCKPVATPVDSKAKLGALDGKPVADPSLYRSLAGALQYLTFTRPDIAYSVQQICLFIHDPEEPPTLMR